MARISLQLGFQKLPCCFFAALVCECVHSGGVFKGILGGGQYKRSIFSSSRLLHFLTVEWMSILLDRFSCEEIFTLCNPVFSSITDVTVEGKTKKSKNGKCNSREMNACLFLFFLLNVSLFSPVSASPSVIWHLQICLYTCVSSPSTHSCAGDTRVGRN